MSKICCGGFELGEGLELNGTTLSATGGSGDSEPLIVEIEGVDTFTASHSPTEIKAAVEAGKTVYCDLGGSSCVPLAFSTVTEACFTHISMGEASAQLNQLIVSANKSVNIRQLDITGTN